MICQVYLCLAIPMIPITSVRVGVTANFGRRRRIQGRKEQYEFGRCSTMSACEGERSAVRVSGFAAQAALLFSPSHAGWAEAVCRGELYQAASHVFDAPAGRCQF